MKKFQLLLSTILFFISTLFFNDCAFGQSLYPDTLFLTKALNNINKRYLNSVENNEQFVNGKEYLTYDKYYLKGHQYFRSSEELEGEVFYDGYLFTIVPFLYDVVLDQIVFSEPSGSLQYKLESQKVNYFKIHEHLFIYIDAGTLSNTPIRTGFYDLLVDGNTQFLAKRAKRIFEDPTPRGMEGEFLIVDKFFIRGNNQYFPVSKKKTIFSVFEDRKKELQRYSRNQHLSFKKENRESSLIKLVQYYNALSLPNLETSKVH